MGMKFNLNDHILVRLTPFGDAVFDEYWSVLPYPEGPHSARMHRLQADGRMRFQMHEAMNTFGKYLQPGFEIPFVGNEIEVVAPSSNG